MQRNALARAAPPISPDETAADRRTRLQRLPEGVCRACHTGARMNALASIAEADTVRVPIPAPCGSTAELRAFIAETMALACVHAELAKTYGTLGDDHGLEYAMRCFTASSKAALDTLADLKAANKGGR
jgi:hypothetical protein